MFKTYLNTISIFMAYSVRGMIRELAVHGVAKSRTRLSDFTFTFHFQEGKGDAKVEKRREPASELLFS